MADVGSIADAVTSLTAAREHFPMWTEWGVEDTSTAVHSLGLSYLLTAGQMLGFAACTEYPVADGVRADCVWWDRHSRLPVACFEFERLKDGSELEGKVRNLLVAVNGLGSGTTVAGLVLWTKSGFPAPAPTIKGLRRLFHGGFRDGRGFQVPGSDPSRLLLFDCQHRMLPNGRLVVKAIERRAS